jgi:lipopolysaccharide transport system permease protein
MQIIKNLLALWAYRGFILASVKREFQLKYQNSLLGATWTVINPLAMIVVYTVIFAQIMHAKLAGVDGEYAYSVFLCAGSLTWGLFAEILGRGQNIFLEHANIIKKINFPRLCLPIISILSSLINFSIIFGLFTLFLVVSNQFIGLIYWQIFPLLLILMMFALGLGMILGVLNVFFRDIGQFFSVFMQFWFWFTPIVYPIAILPAWAKKLIVFNPMFPLIEAFQNLLVKKNVVEWSRLFPTIILSLVLCMIGYHLFRKCATDMVDEL